MTVTDLSPSVTSRAQFSLRHKKHVPAEPGCYVLATIKGDILYIGLSDNLNRRFGEHRADDDKCQVTALGRAFWFYYLNQPAKEIRRLERSWQNQYSCVHGGLPLLNKVASPVV